MDENPLLKGWEERQPKGDFPETFRKYLEQQGGRGGS